LPDQRSTDLKAAVIVPTWHRPHHLTRCLEGLCRQERSPDETLVIVREGDDETLAVVGRMQLPSNVRTVPVGRPGVVAALNAGLRAVRADVVAITDEDAVPRPDWLSRIEKHFISDRSLGALGGRDWLPEAGRDPGRTELPIGQLTWYGRMTGNHHLGLGKPREIDLLKGVNMSFRTAAVSDLQLDERLKGRGAQVYFEVDLSLAVRRAGWRLVYDPAVAVDHYPAERFDEDRRGSKSMAALENASHNETYLLLKWLPWGRRVAALAYWILAGTRSAPGLLIAFERCVRESDRRAVLQRFRAALRGRLLGLRTFISSWWCK
jgi:cellulose synthase/poly-beta-1,6-N-acetylglucosamine synthase-like glycosyltransferase